MLASRLLFGLSLLVLGCDRDGSDGFDDDALVTYADQDGDTILDLHEGFLDPAAAAEGEDSVDSDLDGAPDYLDLDSDQDGIEDIDEAGDTDPMTLPWDSDSDGVPDFRDLDSDDNCIDDRDEVFGDKDNDGIKNWADMDDDGDGINDYWEIGEDCSIPDSDGDGKPDYREQDSDGDGVGDRFEAGTSVWQDEPGDVDGDNVYNYLDYDSDADGFTDTDEGGVTTIFDEPRDTDGDGIYDFLDIDSDADGLLDKDEFLQYGTDPYDDDTDGDGYTDGAELVAETDPLDPGSVISGIYVDVAERSRVEELFEFELVVQMGDVAFLLDTTGSMGGTITGMKTQYADIVTGLSAALPDAEYGVATFDDYAYSPYGYSSSGDKPFILLQQVTDDVGVVQSALSGISLHYGGDGPESSMEALYQALTGAGYDQNCNAAYEAATDVRPFLSASTDPFGGGAGESYDGTTSGGGTLGGMGFRDYALPIIVYATDYNMRDPDASYGTPGGCHIDAGESAVVGATSDLGAYLIGIGAQSTYPITQMNRLADLTGSYADTDGDGLADDRLVFHWTGVSTALRNTIVGAVEDLVGSVHFSEVSLQVDGDTHGFVVAIDPEVYTLSSTASGQVIDFNLTFRGAVAATEEDQVFMITLNVLGDGSVLLDTLDIFVVVPGTSY